jgi:hypothetical protein
MLIVAIYDSHGGHTYGLLNPNTVIETTDIEGNIYQYCPQLTEIQKHLWYNITVPALEATKELAGKDPIAVVSGGDITHGNGYKEELVTTRISDQKFIAEANFLPFIELKNTEYARFVKGTGVHEFGEGSASIEVAKLFQNRFPNKDIKTLYHGLINIDGYGIDYSHHGPTPGKRNWLKGNEARYYLRSLMMDDLSLGKSPPNLVLRGHYHDPVKEYLSIDWSGTEHESWLYILPSMCFPNDFATKVTKSQYIVTTGIVIFEIVSGHLVQTYKFATRIDTRTKEIIKL